MKTLNRVYEFTLEELYTAGGIEGMNDMCQSRYETEEAENSGILGNLEFYPHHINEEQGLIGIQVIAEIHSTDQL